MFWTASRGSSRRICDAPQQHRPNPLWQSLSPSSFGNRRGFFMTPLRCARRFAQWLIVLAACAFAVPLSAQVDFGDDASQWARDGECDDPRFEGEGGGRDAARRGSRPRCQRLPESLRRRPNRIAFRSERRDRLWRRREPVGSRRRMRRSAFCRRRRRGDADRRRSVSRCHGLPNLAQSGACDRGHNERGIPLRTERRPGRAWLAAIG